MAWLLTEAGMDGLNVNVIAWVIVNGTTRVNQLMNSFIVFHQALSDGTDKKISQQQIFSTLESNNLVYRMWKVPCFNLLIPVNKIYFAFGRLEKGRLEKIKKSLLIPEIIADQVT